MGQYACSKLQSVKARESVQSMKSKYDVEMSPQESMAVEAIHERDTHGTECEADIVTVDVELPDALKELLLQLRGSLSCGDKAIREVPDLTAERFGYFFRDQKHADGASKVVTRSAVRLKVLHAVGMCKTLRTFDVGRLSWCNLSVAEWKAVLIPMQANSELQTIKLFRGPSADAVGKIGPLLRNLVGNARNLVRLEVCPYDDSGLTLVAEIASGLRGNVFLKLKSLTVNFLAYTPEPYIADLVQQVAKIISLAPELRDLCLEDVPQIPSLGRKSLSRSLKRCYKLEEVKIFHAEEGIVDVLLEVCTRSRPNVLSERLRIRPCASVLQRLTLGGTVNGLTGEKLAALLTRSYITVLDINSLENMHSFSLKHWRKLGRCLLHPQALRTFRINLDFGILGFQEGEWEKMENGLAALWRASQRSPILSISMEFLYETDILPFLEKAVRNTYLKAISFRKCYISSPAFRSFVVKLAKNTSVHTLKLFQCYNDHYHDSWAHLFLQLREKTSIKELDLTGCEGLNDDNFKAMLKLLEVSFNLQTVGLVDTKWEEDGKKKALVKNVVALWESLQRNWHQLDGKEWDYLPVVTDPHPQLLLLPPSGRVRIPPKHPPAQGIIAEPRNDLRRSKLEFERHETQCASLDISIQQSQTQVIDGRNSHIEEVGGKGTPDDGTSVGPRNSIAAWGIEARRSGVKQQMYGSNGAVDSVRWRNWRALETLSARVEAISVTEKEKQWNPCQAARNVPSSTKLRPDVTALGFQNFNQEFDPERVLCIYTVFQDNVKILFFHVEGMARLFGVGLSSSSVLLREDGVVEVRQLQQHVWMNCWTQSEMSNFSLVVFDSTVASGEQFISDSSLRSTFQAFSPRQAAEEFGVGLEGTDNLVRMGEFGCEVTSSAAISPSWIGSLYHLLRYMDHAGNDAQEQNTDTEHEHSSTFTTVTSELSLPCSSSSHRATIPPEKDQLSQGEEIPEVGAMKRERNNQPLFLAIIIRLDHESCTFYSAAEGRELRLDRENVTPRFVHSETGEVSTITDASPCEFFLVPEVTISFYYYPHLEGSGSKKMKTKLDANFLIDSSVSEPDKFGWYHDQLRLSFKCLRPDKVRRERRDNEILSNHEIKTADLGGAKSNSTLARTVKGKEHQMFAGHRTYANIQMGTSSKKENTIATNHNQESTAKISAVCLKDLNFSLRKVERPSELAYMASIFPPFHLYNIWDDACRELALSSGMMSAVPIMVEGDWEVRENDDLEEGRDRFCRYEFSCQRELKLFSRSRIERVEKQERNFLGLPNRKLAITLQTEENSIMIHQKLAHVFLINHEFSHMKRLERPHPYVWDMVGKPQATCPQPADVMLQ